MQSAEQGLCRPLHDFFDAADVKEVVSGLNGPARGVTNASVTPEHLRNTGRSPAGTAPDGAPAVVGRQAMLGGSTFAAWFVPQLPGLFSKG